MRFLLGIYFLLITWNSLLVQCGELVGTLIPKSIHKNKPFYTFIQVYDLEEPTELAIQLHTTNRTYELIEDGYKHFQFNVNRFGMRKSINLTTTLFREKKTRGMAVKQCNTQIREIKVDESRFYIFIQMSKPIYKPGDIVRFRIIVVDKDMIPYHMNNIDITITDPYDRVMQNYDDLSDENNGFFSNEYTLSPSTLLGDWKMTVVVEKNHHLMASKIFPVQKYALPLFAVSIKTSSKNYLPNHKLIISFGAKYSFGEYVTGNAQLMIRDQSDNRTCFTNNYNSIKGIETVTLNINNDLGGVSANQMHFTATVTFTEPETGIQLIKSTGFSVHKSEEMSIKTVHSNTYTPGLPFNMKVFAKKWNGDKFITNEKVRIDYIYTHKDGSKTKSQMNVDLDDGVANGEVIVPVDVTNFDIECRFISSKVYRARLKQEKVEHARNSMALDFRPKRPKYGSQVEVFANSAYRMEKILTAVVTKYGIVSKSKAIACADKTVCNFSVEITPDMLPRFAVEVYHIRDKDIVEHGSIEIETDNLGMNHLDMKLSHDNVKAKADITMTFDTSYESTIYLLAIDKRLKFIRDGNDVAKEEVVKELSLNDGQSEVLLDDMTTWHKCTDEEVKRIESGRVDKAVAHSTDTFEASDDSENIDDDDFDPYQEESPPVVSQEPTEDDLLRQDFPETWLFETIEVEDEPVTKQFKVPDSITSWHISAFSLNKHAGLAIMDPQELTVKNEFFVQLTLPYSIRYKEVLKLDILVFNYVQDNKPLDVKIVLRNLQSSQFQFVEYVKNGNNCKPTYSNNLTLTQNVNVPGLGMKKVSFYIRSNPIDENDRSNKVKLRKIQVFADATDNSGKFYRDRVQKILKVEPVGVRKFNTEAHTFMVKGNSLKSNSELNATNVNTNTVCIVNGDFLTDIINLNSGFEIYPGDCLEQRTSKLKGNVQVYKYFQTKKKTVKKDYFSNQYQAIWDSRGKRYNYESSVGYISYFIDAVVPAMELKLISTDIDAIEKELDKLKAAQTSSGTFENFGKFPDIGTNDDNRRNTPTYFQTAFVLISFLKAKEFVKQNYTDVIDKAFAYLDSESNRNSVDNEGVSIAAYAYALGMKYDSGREYKAKGFLDKIEEAIIDYGGNKRCFKIKREDSNCHMRHTAYAAMAYLKLDEIDKAMPLIYWLLKEYNFYIYQGYTYNTAIISEPIADAAVALGVDVTDFEVTLEYENKIVKKLKYNNKNINDYREIPFVPNANKIRMVVDGTGFCSITRVNELMIIESEMTEQFSVEVNVKPSKASNEKIINVCASFDSADLSKHSILNVVYEVEFPSGYIYAGIVDEQNYRKDIKQVEERKGKTLILIYYNDFENRKTYCVDTKITKAYEVRNSQNAGVKVYDFNEKQNIAVEFYDIKTVAAC